MAKRRQAKNEELLLIPFLDILCSLIGVLVLIVVVLCVAQTQRAKGRSQEEIDRSLKYVDALKKQKELSQYKNVLQEDVAKVAELRKVAEEKKERIAKLRKLLGTTKEIQKMNEELNENLIKELDNLLLEIDGFKREQTGLQKQIAELTEELKKRQVPTQKVVPPVVIQPGGSGMAQGAKIFFVEASGGKLSIFWDSKKKTVLSAAPEVVIADPAFNFFLGEVKKVPQSKIIFVVRDDGMSAYNNAVGWAQSTYGYGVSQIGKIPAPGRGAIDLAMFRDYLGTMTPPPDAKVDDGSGKPAAAPTPAPAPAPAKPAAAPAPGAAPAKPAAPPAAAPAAAPQTKK